MVSGASSSCPRRTSLSSRRSSTGSGRRADQSRRPPVGGVGARRRRRPATRRPSGHGQAPIASPCQAGGVSQVTSSGNTTRLRPANYSKPAGAERIDDAWPRTLPRMQTDPKSEMSNDDSHPVGPTGVFLSRSVLQCGRPSESARWRPADAAHSRPSPHAGAAGTRQPCRCRPRPAPWDDVPCGYIGTLGTAGAPHWRRQSRLIGATGSSWARRRRCLIRACGASAQPDSRGSTVRTRTVVMPGPGGDALRAWELVICAHFWDCLVGTGRS